MTTTLREQLSAAAKAAMEDISNAGDPRSLEEVRVKYLGRKGELKQVLKGLGALPADERPAMGELANRLSDEVSEALEARAGQLQEAATGKRLSEERVDVTLPGRPQSIGRLHPITQIVNQVVQVFVNMGFDVATGPEIEKDYYNFEALNFPPDHPARDAQDTFYIRRGSTESHSPDDLLLRTHTSPVQIRNMENRKPPIRIVCPGRVYRNETPDPTHLPMFIQVEGFMVDEGITFADLKGALECMVHEIFGPDITLRFRPSFFPFTEPSAEVDILCIHCKGEGCRVCKGSGFVEILGSGMIDPNVLKAVNIDPEKYTGWAFGIGAERIAMLKWQFPDLRMFYENDVRVLRQF